MIRTPLRHAIAGRSAGRRSSREVRRRAAANGHDALLELQRSAGNRAVVELIDAADTRAGGSIAAVVSGPAHPSTVASSAHVARTAGATSPVRVQRGLAGDVARGAWSWVTDLGRGARRSARGLKVWDEKALLKIAAENESAARLFARLVRGGVSGAIAIFSNLIEIVIAGLVSWKLLPQSIKDLALEKLGSGAQAAIRAVVTKWIGKRIVREMVAQIARRIVTTSAYKLIAKKLGVSAAFSSTGVGIPIGLLGLQGIIEKAARAADRLKARFPMIYAPLAPRDLHMAWFLVEPYVEMLRLWVHVQLIDMLSGARDGRILIDAGSGDGRTPIRSGP